MTVEAKICGVRTAEALDAAVRGGAGMIGFNFFPPSPRAVTPDQARALCERIDGACLAVGLFVDPGDEELSSTLATAGLDLIQLHGQEPPERVAEVRARFGLPVMKVIKIAMAEDLDDVAAYAETADRFLFEPKVPKTMPGALPGGNAVSFDWQLLAGRAWPRPWMIAGGLTPENVAEAVETSGAPAVDVSSGVESARGVKDPAKIARFLELVQRL